MSSIMSRIGFAGMMATVVVAFILVFGNQLWAMPILGGSFSGSFTTCMPQDEEEDDDERRSRQDKEDDLGQKTGDDEEEEGEEEKESKLPEPAKASGDEGIEPGDTVPQVEGEDVDGVEFALSDYEGKVVMLDFWGDW